MECDNAESSPRIQQFDHIIQRIPQHIQFMVQFNPDEPVEVSALQMVNILFCTPQVSVMVGQISAEQRQMLKFWLNFMSDKRELLQKSELMPHRCDANYSYVTVRNDGEELHAMYSERLLMLDKPRKRVYVVNAVDW